MNVAPRSSLATLLVMALATLSTAWLADAAQAADIEGSADHALVGRYEGSEIVAYQVGEYDETRVVDGPFSNVNASSQTGPGFKTLEGRIVLIYYKLPQGRSTLEVLRNYEDSLKAKGFTVLFTCATSKGTCFDTGKDEGAYYLGQSVGDAQALPRMMGDYVHNWFGQGRYLLARLDRPEGAVYASITLGDSDRSNVAIVRVVETKEMEANKIVFVNASEMEKAINDTGKIALYGILFDFDKDIVKPESKPTLDEIAKLLQAKPELKLLIVGHTDNEGTAEYNLDLSRRRAANVVVALTSAYGIAADRLSAQGAGASSPIASNDDEAGRAENRRVELVAQSGAGAPPSQVPAQAAGPEPSSGSPPPQITDPQPQNAPPQTTGQPQTGGPSTRPSGTLPQTGDPQTQIGGAPPQADGAPTQPAGAQPQTGGAPSQPAVPPQIAAPQPPSGVPQPPTGGPLLQAGVVTVLLPVDVYIAPGGSDPEKTGTFLAAGTQGVTLIENKDPWFHVKWPAGEGWVYSGEGYVSLQLP
jgi:outer membrane protein OmpA-like peptidoglycan-associated protein